MNLKVLRQKINRHNLWIKEEVLALLDETEKPLREYINFIDNARSHAPSTEMKVKYKVYKEWLGE